MYANKILLKYIHKFKVFIKRKKIEKAKYIRGKRQ